MSLFVIFRAKIIFRCVIDLIIAFNRFGCFLFHTTGFSEQISGRLALQKQKTIFLSLFCQAGGIDKYIQLSRVGKKLIIVFVYNTIG